MLIKDLPIQPEAKSVLIDSGITELFPPQREAVEAGVLEGKNLILASPTASGKTLISELSALRHILDEGGKVLYLTPLKALASEKYSDFRKYSDIRKMDGRRISVGITTGDLDSSDPWLTRFDIIITTNEKCDSLLRHRTNWLERLSLVVADEIHLLNNIDRGPTLEIVLARLLQINPRLQVLALSATVRNVEEIAEWLRAVPVTTDWRPVTLREGVLFNSEVLFKDGGSSYIDRSSKDLPINLALNSISQGGQTLIFASSRKNSVSLAKRAAVKMNELLSRKMQRSLGYVANSIINSGERTRVSDLLADLVRSGVAFHHAGLAGSHRRIIEDSFREGKIKIVTATPTLAFGVNLPARTVIISDYRRYIPGYGYYPIEVLEYKQMVGRAGRPTYDKIGESVLIAKTEEEKDYLFNSFVLAKPERIWSKLGVEKVLRSHVLATIASEFACTEKGVYDFFGRTLYAFQYDLGTIKSIITKILNFLYKEGMISVDRQNIYATPFGKRISQLYIDPLSAIIIREGFTRRASKITNLSFFHLIAHTPDMFPKVRLFAKEIERLAMFAYEHRHEFLVDIPDEWDDRIIYEEHLGEIKASLVLRKWIDESSEEDIIEHFNFEPGDLYHLIETSKWLLHASKELGKLLKHKDLLPRLAELQERVVKGVKRELLDLTRLEGIGRVRARILFNVGLKSKEDLKKTSVKRLTELPLIGVGVAKRIKEQVGGFVKNQDWNRLSKEKRSEQQSLTDYYSK